MSTTKKPSRASRSAAPRCSASFEKAMRDVRQRAAERIRMAGKHVCVAIPAGEVSRVTGRGDRILKRPVVDKIGRAACRGRV